MDLNEDAFEGGLWFMEDGLPAHATVDDVVKPASRCMPTLPRPGRTVVPGP